VRSAACFTTSILESKKIFSQIAIKIDQDLPAGEGWHIQLLKRMTIPIEGIRPQVIDEKLENDLEEYLRFRHLFRNIYGFELKWINASL